MGGGGIIVEVITNMCLLGIKNIHKDGLG